MVSLVVKVFHISWGILGLEVQKYAHWDENTGKGERERQKLDIHVLSSKVKLKLIHCKIPIHSVLCKTWGVQQRTFLSIFGEFNTNKLKENDSFP